jgi:CarD family transcriptional regulator
MAQKKKVPAKSSTPKLQAKAPPKVRAAVAAKPARKSSESKSAPTARKSQPAKSQAASQNKSMSKFKPAAKVAPAKAPSAKAATAPKPAAKAPVKTIAKAPQKPVADKAVGKPAAQAPGAAKASPSKPTASAAPPVVAGKQPAAAQAPAKAIKPATPAAAPPLVAKPGAAQSAAVGAARTVSSASAKPAVRTFPSPATGTSAAANARDLALKAAEQRKQQMASAAAAAPVNDASKKPVVQRHGFKINESIVYPAHGVGRIVGIEEQEIAGMSLELFVIQFEKDKMTLRVPTGKLQSVGMRKLAEDDIVGKAMETLKGRARIKRTMWSRRAQEYEAKINSGDLISIAEVVRDLYRSESQPEQSYSERQLYEAALDRMAREIAAVSRIDERGATQRITEVLSKSAKGRRAAEEADSAEASGDAKAA